MSRFPVPPASIPPVPGERRTLRASLALRHAGMREVDLHVERSGRRGAPVVAVLGGISAHRHVHANACDAGPGWWQAQAGPRAALDTDRFELLSIDWLGADGALDAVIDPADQADALVAVLDALRIERLHAVVGASYGAQVALQLAARHAGRLRSVVAISGVHRAHPHASAWRALQRRALALGALQCDDAHGLALARQLALLSYRTPEEFDARFGAARVVDGQVRVAAEAWLDHCGAAFATRMPARAYARLSESLDLQDVQPETIRVPVTVVAVAEDRLVPLSDAYALAERLRGETRLRVLRSRYGHDAFLKETVQVERVLREALEIPVATPACPPAAVAA